MESEITTDFNSAPDGTMAVAVFMDNSVVSLPKYWRGDIQEVVNKSYPKAKAVFVPVCQVEGLPIGYKALFVNDRIQIAVDEMVIAAEKLAKTRATCEQEIATKANPQEQEGARNRIVLAMARKQAPLKADLDLLDWVEARRAQCESDVQQAAGE